MSRTTERTMGPARTTAHSSAGRRRERLTSPRRFLASSRLRLEAAVGRVLVRGRRTSSSDSLSRTIAGSPSSGSAWMNPDAGAENRPPHEGQLPSGTYLLTGLASFIHYGAHIDGFRLAWFDLFTKNRALSEALCRTIVSRAYYAAYHLARAYTVELGFPETDKHRFLSDALSASGEPSVKQAGDLLRVLLRARGRADYELAKPNVITNNDGALRVQPLSSYWSVLLFETISPAADKTVASYEHGCSNLDTRNGTQPALTPNGTVVTDLNP